MRVAFLTMFVLVRAVTYAALFIGFVLVYLSSRFLSWSGIVEPATTGPPQVAGMIMVIIGTAIALWCVFTFVFSGKGTPAPFDPPRKLVVRGPYRFRAQSDVHRRRNDPRRRGTLLRIIVDLDLCRLVLSHNSPVRGVVRRADVATNFRR
jgi:hypothetical protein